MLRHDKAIAHPIKAKEHLKVLPQYLIPISMRGVVNSSGNSKRKKRLPVRGESKETRIKRSKANDPLYSMPDGGETSHDGDQVALANDDGDDYAHQNSQRNVVENDMKVYSRREASGLGRSHSGRKDWKARHKKGEFNPKLRKKNAHRTPGSFIKSKKYK